jgi:hypothetical protein
LRQDVDQKSADELGSGQCHDLLAITTFSAIVRAADAFNAIRRDVAHLWERVSR